MTTENRRMSRWRLLFVLALASCTQPNPRNCADGTCTDPAFPYCDADGSISNQPGTCIAVACTPMEFIECEGDRAVLCNAQGTNYNVVECQLGCDAATMSCRNCETNAECDNPQPVCDLERNSCRVCELDDECDSRVCDLNTGACVVESAVVYAGPAAPDTGLCTLMTPCAFSRAITIASSAAVTPTIRLLPGAYAGNVVINADVGLRIVGTGAEFTGVLTARGGANLEIRNLRIVDIGGVEVFCGDPAGNSPSEAMSGMTLHRVDFPGVQAYRCVVAASESGLGVSLYQDTTFTGDRLWRAGVGISSEPASVVVTNSVFDGSPGIQTAGGVDGINAKFAFNTFYIRGDNFFFCPPATPDTIIVENNIIYAPETTNAIEGDGCDVVRNNLLFPQALVRPGNIVADPKLVNPTAGDLHLMSGSPAIDQAMPSPGLSTDHDADGVGRPQGPTLDIGAFERVP